MYPPPCFSLDPPCAPLSSHFACIGGDNSSVGMRDEGEKRENVPVDWMNELKKEEDSYTRSPRNRKRKRKKHPLYCRNQRMFQWTRQSKLPSVAGDTARACYCGRGVAISSCLTLVVLSLRSSALLCIHANKKENKSRKRTWEGKRWKTKEKTGKVMDVSHQKFRAVPCHRSKTHGLISSGWPRRQSVIRLGGRKKLPLEIWPFYLRNTCVCIYIYIVVYYLATFILFYLDYD